MPVYSFGENELFKQVIFSEGSLGRRLQDLFKNIMGFAPCLFLGEHFAFLPYRTPITTVGEYFIDLQKQFVCCIKPMLFSLCFFQWEVRSWCQSASRRPRKRSTTITDFTWRPCPSFSTNTRSNVDFLKVTSFKSFRQLTLL